MAEPGLEVKVARVINASPDDLWGRIADVSRMGEISPENVGCVWKGGATGPAVGAKFKGENRNGKKKWSTDAVITDVEPGRLFAFNVTAGPFKIARWVYRFEPVDGGCRVTETWIDQRGWVGRTAGKTVSGVSDRAAHNRATMEATLDQLAALAEAGA